MSKRLFWSYFACSRLCVVYLFEASDPVVVVVVLAVVGQVVGGLAAAHEHRAGCQDAEAAGSNPPLRVLAVHRHCHLMGFKRNLFKSCLTSKYSSKQAMNCCLLALVTEYLFILVSSTCIFFSTCSH